VIAPDVDAYLSRPVLKAGMFLVFISLCQKFSIFYYTTEPTHALQGK
jgi:hypothetical protein